MPQTVTFKITTAYEDGGPKIPEAKRANKVSSSTSLIEEIQNDKVWQEFEVNGGDRSQIEFLMLAADRYMDEQCPREDEPGLLFKFDSLDNFALHLDGPLLYSGHTTSCLPPKVEKIYVQNRMAKNVKFYLLLGRKQKKKDKTGMHGQMMPAGAQPAPATPATATTP